ncbi:MAG: tetratricopeptide repeat protein [Winogradskyella sp.]|nr:tetratricopeptide repeat protein [Winogradskyella sp.]NNL83134.1 tetratricopeptide repeat protein [Winogradskyella sp.]
MRIILLCFLFSTMVYAQPSVEQAEELITKKEFKEAEKLLVPFIKRDESNLKAIEVLGDAYGHQKKWDEAIEQYEKLKDANPKNANYHYKYGGALGMKALQISKLRALGLIGDLKRSFETAARLDPNHIDARWALVELYMTLPGIVGGSKDKSLKYADELESLSKVDGYLAKGYVYEYDDQPDLAEQYYLKAIKVGGSVTCYDKLTKLYESQQKPHEAIGNIELAQQKHQRNALHYQIGKVSADYNVQLDKGEKCLKAYISNYSSADGVPKEWAYYRLAQIFKHKKDKTRALRYINKALSLRSDFKQAIAEKATIQSM